LLYPKCKPILGGTINYVCMTEVKDARETNAVFTLERFTKVEIRKLRLTAQQTIVFGNSSSGADPGFF